MVTDGIMEVLQTMAYMLKGEQRDTIEMVWEMLSDYDEDEWYLMSEKRKEEWIAGYIK